MVRRLLLLLVFASALPLLGGCLERRIFITSNPSGALVHLNDVEVGRTPVDVDFTYYGVYDVRLSKEGYAPLHTSAEAEMPLYEQPGIDLIAEALPTRTVTEIRWHFDLEPRSSDPDAVISRARTLRERIGATPDGQLPEGVMGPPIPVQTAPGEEGSEPEYPELLPEARPQE